MVEEKRESMPLPVDYLEGTDTMNFQIQFDGGLLKTPDRNELFLGSEVMNRRARITR